jgi:hypothetical protein
MAGKSMIITEYQWLSMNKEIEGLRYINLHTAIYAAELCKALERVIDDLALRAQIKGEDSLDISQGRLMAADKAITNYKDSLK